MEKIVIFILVLVLAMNTYAQNSSPEIVSSAGATYKGNSMQIDWTLGELAITSIQNSSQQLTQGFHQPNYTITSVGK